MLQHAEAYACAPPLRHRVLVNPLHGRLQPLVKRTQCKPGLYLSNDTMQASGAVKVWHSDWFNCNYGRT